MFKVSVTVACSYVFACAVSVVVLGSAVMAIAVYGGRYRYKYGATKWSSGFMAPTI